MLLIVTHWPQPAWMALLVLISLSSEPICHFGVLRVFLLHAISRQEPNTSSDACRSSRSALVCDGVDEAKRLAYMGPERHKVVAQDGTLIAKSGCITGGLTGSEAERAQRFDEQRTMALKEVRHRRTVTTIATVPLDLLQ